MQYQQSALAYFKHIASILHDDEPDRPFARFTLPDLLDAFNKGMSIVYAYRPDLFTELCRVKLKTGFYQNFNDQCDKILQVVEQVTEDGSTIKHVITEYTNLASGGRHSAFALKRLPTIPRAENNEPINYTIDAVSIDREISTSFKVFPPVPPEIDAYVIIKCIRSPRPISLYDIDNAIISNAVHSTAVSHYIIALMLTGNRDAPNAISQSQYHMQQFYQILQIEYQQDERLKQTQSV